MSVCKSKTKCFNYFVKKKVKVNLKEIIKLIFSDTKTVKNDSKKHSEKNMHKKLRETREYEVSETTNAFIENLENALLKHESAVANKKCNDI